MAIARERRILPLACLVRGFLFLHSKTSLRALLLGKDPSCTPRFLANSESRIFNRGTLVDVYGLIWPCVEIALLALTAILQDHAIWATVVAVAIVWRLHEMFGNILHVLIHRSQYDYVSERKMALTLLAYLEPMLLFGVLHGMLAAIVPYYAGQSCLVVYDLGGRSMSAIAMFHFSVACYTTVGWGDVTAVHPLAMLASSIESIIGLLMLAFTVSAFIGRTLGNVEGKSQ